MGEVSAHATTTILDKLESHMQSRFLVQPLNESVFQTATDLLDRYDLRAYDSLQLAGCLVLKATSGRDQPVFVCADRDLLAAASGEGLEVHDPA